MWQVGKGGRKIRWKGGKGGGGSEVARGKVSG